MRTVVLTLTALIVGLALGSLIPGALSRRGKAEHVRYFAVRPTVPAIFGEDPIRSDGPLHECGSQEIAFVEGEAMVRIYRIDHGKKERLHQLTVVPEWFRSVWFTPFERKSGAVGIVMTARSLLRSADPKAIPEGYDSDENPSVFDRYWEYDLGQVASIFSQCNQHGTTTPLWKPGIETPALYYQFSRGREDFRFLAQEGNIMFSEMSGEAMIDASAKEPDVGFILVTVEILAD